MKQRILSVDFVKFISIFLVVWCHVIEGIDTDGFWQNSVHHVIYSFHMPLFMLISGYLFFNTISHMKSGGHNNCQDQIFGSSDLCLEHNPNKCRTN